MKQITIAGNIGKSAEVRHTPKGDAVAGFSVAVNTGRDQPPMWFDVSLWGKRGEALAQYLTKGSKVTVAGDLTSREHEGKTYLGVRADQVTLQGGRPNEGGGDSGGQGGGGYGGNNGGGSQGGGYGGSQGGGGGRSDLDDEIPFAPETRI